MKKIISGLVVSSLLAVGSMPALANLNCNLSAKNSKALAALVALQTALAADNTTGLQVRTDIYKGATGAKPYAYYINTPLTSGKRYFMPAIVKGEMVTPPGAKAPVWQPAASGASLDKTVQIDAHHQVAEIVAAKAKGKALPDGINGCIFSGTVDAGSGYFSNGAVYVIHSDGLD